MRYISTRGGAPALDFADTLLTGLARDGGLYVPETWPRLDPSTLRDWRDLDYCDLATRVMTPFLGGAIGEDDFAAMVRASYREFAHPAVAPLVQLDSHDWLLELFHGPTLAFKDFALQLLGRLFDHVLERRDMRITIVGATSGDTGSAAIEAFRGRARVDIHILHPHERTSEIQRRQMTTVDAANVHNLAVRGSFDDCQDLVKTLFNDAAFRDEFRLSAINSINWARIMAQCVYYIHAGLALGAPDRDLSFCVPTGNFGNVFAAYGARQMGLPVSRLIVASNANDILDRFFAHNDMSMRDVVPTLSPSMDIQVSSNFERYLFDLLGRDGPRTDRAMRDFRTSGRLEADGALWQDARRLFTSCRFSDEETLAEMARIYETTGHLLDPHSAIGIAAARRVRAGTTAAERQGPVITLATAHPAKFPDSVVAATGQRPELPARLADLHARPENFRVIDNDADTLRHIIREANRAGMETVA